MGLGSVSLWALDVVWRFVGMVARTGVGRRLSIVRSGRRLMCPSSDSEADLDLALVSGGADGAALAGCRLGLAIVSTHGGEDMVAGLVLSALTESEATAGLGESRHCMAALDSRTWRTSMIRTSQAELPPWVREDSALDELQRWQRLMRS